MIACLPSQRRREAQNLQRNCLSNICLSGRAGQINAQKNTHKKKRRPTIAPDNQIYTLFFFAFFLSDSIFLSSHFLRRRFGLKKLCFCLCFLSWQKRFNKQNLQKPCRFLDSRAPRADVAKSYVKIQNKKFAIVSRIKLHGVGP